jgi:membrane-associated PAP2 superfamily phosphatase
MNSRTLRDGTTALAMLLLALAWEASGGDWVVAQHYGNASGFAAQYANWATQLHTAGRWLALLCWGACGVYACWPGHGTSTRRLAWAGVVGVLLAALLVASIKQASSAACPWSLQGFGGQQAYASHWLQWGGRATSSGQCFPSGHASAAFAFLPLFTLWRDHRPGWARLAMVCTVVLGAAFGWLQVARGAHFVSHVLWSAWLCWLVAMWLPPVVAWMHQRSGLNPGLARCASDPVPLR